MSALQLTADDHLSRRIDAVNLKHRLGDVETDCRDRLHAWLPRNCDRPSDDHFNGTYAPVGEPSTASLADHGPASARVAQKHSLEWSIGARYFPCSRSMTGGKVNKT